MKMTYLSCDHFALPYPTMSFGRGLLTFLLLLVLTDGTAQSIRTFDKNQNTYLVGQQIYKYKEMGPLFDDDPVHRDLYDQSLKHLTRGRVAAVIGGVGVGLGVLGLALDGPEENCLVCIPTNTIRLLFSAIALQAAALLGGLSISRHRAKKKMLLELYNSRYDTSLLQHFESQDYTFSPSSSGLGITMHF